jgi:hypothetical protein
MIETKEWGLPPGRSAPIMFENQESSRICQQCFRRRASDEFSIPDIVIGIREGDIVEASVHLDRRRCQKPFFNRMAIVTNTTLNLLFLVIKTIIILLSI